MGILIRFTMAISGEFHYSSFCSFWGKVFYNHYAFVVVVIGNKNFLLYFKISLP